MLRLSQASIVIAVASAGEVTPIEKVITLLSKLKSDVEAQGQEEAKTYGEFAAWCKGETESRSADILKRQDTIDLASATLGEKNAELDDESEKMSQRQVDQETMTRKLKEAEVRCEKGKVEYDASARDLNKAIIGLEGAYKALSESKPASLLEVSRSVNLPKIVATADALHLRLNPKQRTALVQGKVDPDDPDYKFKSDDILSTIQGLLDEFNKAKQNLDTEYQKAKSSCDDEKAALNTQMEENSIGMSAGKLTMDGLRQDIADTTEELLKEEKMLKFDKLYMTDMTDRCEKRAVDWDQRSAQRAGEVEALSKALTIIRDGAEGNEGDRALLLQRRAKPVSLVQVEKHSEEHTHAVTIRKVDTADQNAAESTLTARVGDFLQTEGSRIGSTMLATAAMRVGTDPFIKVKGLIQKLIERLVAEATAEASKKGFCDTELGKAEKDRDFRLADTKKLAVTVGGLEAKKDALQTEIKELTDALEDLKSAHEEAVEERGFEKVDNLAAIKTAQEGLAAVKEAIGVLKAFYSGAAKADEYHSGRLKKVSLLQASPIDEEGEAPDSKSVTGAYKGNQEAATGILGLLAVIESDFERTAEKTQAAESQSAAEFVKFDRTTKADISAKTTKKTSDEEDLASTRNAIASGMDDLTNSQGLLDDALKRLVELQPTCIDTGMTHEERVKKREEEMAALKKALCMLDINGVEGECA